MACGCCSKLFIFLWTKLSKHSVNMNKTLPKSSAVIKSYSSTNSNLVNQTSNVTNKFVVLPSPVKSESDKKEYKVIRLENGLTACLISDKSNISNSEFNSNDFDSESESETESESSEHTELEDEDDCKRQKSVSEEQKMAAAALCVGVGSFSDPKSIPGLAHFLEHMVFMGSEKFPEENDFDSFIKKGGGSDNASTDCETTTFYFECLEKHLYKGLDKFAQFFISPLMKKESMTREREAVHSEFQMALPSDTYRKEQLLASLCNPESPAHAFTWGNLETLRDNVSDSTLYEKLHEFRKKHYSAHRMTLAIQARLPMSVLESYVVDCFSKVPSNNLPANDFKEFANGIFDTPQFKRLYYVKPVKDICQVDLTWALPSLLHMYKSKPHQYVSWLLGHEGEGSLLSYLRKKVWVLAIFTGNGESGSEHNSMYALFSVSMILSSEGLEHLPEVIEAMFSYINMLKELGPQERIFKEIQTIEDTSFRFADEECAVDLVEDLAESMQYYPPEDYLTGSDLYFEYNPEAIEMVLNHLVPDKMNIMVFDQKYLPEGMSYDKIEPWFKTPYTDLEIPQEWLAKWSSPKPNEEFALPIPNIYLTTDFSMLPSITNLPEYPEKVINTPLAELWYRKDDKFKLPLAYYFYYLITPKSIESPLSACMMDIFVTILSIQLSEEAYPASLAELSYSIAAKDRGIIIKVEGYNEKLPVLLELVFTYLKNVSNNLTDKLFEAVKDKLKKSYYNKFLKPSTLSKDLRLSILLNGYWPPIDKYEVISQVTFEMMQNFSRDIITKLYIKGLVQGNLTRSVAVDTSNKLIKCLGYEPLLPDTYPKFSVVQLPKGESCCRIMSFNKNDSNSIITNYYQSGVISIKSSVIVELLMLIIDEPLFDILRTKEQLGYNVFSTLRDTYGVLGYSITVNAQASKHSVDHVDNRIESFIRHVRKLLNRMSAKQLNTIKKDLIKVKLCGDVLLREEVGRNWGEITSDQYIFDRLNQEIKIIDEVLIQDLRRWWEDHNMFEKNTNFKKLSIQVVGYSVEKNDAAETTQEEIECPTDAKFCLQYVTDDNIREDYLIKNINEFKQRLCLYQLGDKLL